MCASSVPAGFARAAADRMGQMFAVCRMDAGSTPPVMLGVTTMAAPPAPWPDIQEVARIRWTRVILAAAHLDHDPGNNRPRNLKSFCQRCHLIHDRPHHLTQRRITYLLRRALGDLFLGPYSR
jgi:hypothetical protein